MRFLLVLAVLLIAPAAVAQTGAETGPSPYLDQVEEPALEEEAETAQEPTEPPDMSLHQFVYGFLRYSAYHEMGHALISVLSLPVPGAEEDAVDDYAYSRSDGRDMTAAAEYWRLIHAETVSSQSDRSPMDIRNVMGVHGVPLRRAGRAICYLYASQRLTARTQERFGLNVDQTFDDRELEDCSASTTGSATAWKTLLLEHAANGARMPKVDAMVDYRSAGEQFEHAKAYLEATGLLWDLKEDFEQLRAPTDSREVHLIATECGMANAFWVPRGDPTLGLPPRSLVLCYEDVADLFERGRALGLR